MMASIICWFIASLSLMGGIAHTEQGAKAAEPMRSLHGASLRACVFAAVGWALLGWTFWEGS